MTERIDIITRIANLRALAGGTGHENEALSALAAADRLMQAYRVEEAEIAMAEARGEIKLDIVRDTQEGAVNNGRARHKVQACIWDIADYCEVKLVATTQRAWGSSTQTLNWIGDRPDVELAKQLVVQVRDAMEHEYARWKRTQQGVGSGAKPTFQLAMAGVVNTRLRELRQARATERKAALLEAQAALTPAEGERLGIAVAAGDLSELTSTALVVVAAAEVKKVEVDRAFASAYGSTRLGTASGFRYRSGGSSAYGAGREAGARVNLGRGLLA